jgi:Domain of unknown function (DUF4258)
MPFEQILQEIRQKILQENYVVTVHADEEMDDDRLSIWDVEECILTGKILERQRDRITGESKYRIQGCSLEGEPMETLVKLGLTGKVVVITVYAL